MRELFAHWAHSALHSCRSASAAGVGTFTICSQRFGRYCDVTFRPDLDGARRHTVPNVKDADGVLLIQRMMQAPDALTAMALLRSASQA